MQTQKSSVATFFQQRRTATCFLVISTLCLFNGCGDQAKTVETTQGAAGIPGTDSSAHSLSDNVEFYQMPAPSADATDFSDALSPETVTRAGRKNELAEGMSLGESTESAPARGLSRDGEDRKLQTGTTNFATQPGFGRGIEPAPSGAALPLADPAEKPAAELSKAMPPADQLQQSLVPGEEMARENVGQPVLSAGEAAPAADAGISRGRMVLRRQAAVETGERGIQAVELRPGEELWVIAKPAEQNVARPVHPDVPGCGALMAQLPDQTKTVPVPLKHTAVTGNIDGYVASVDVVQQFHNPYSSKIEAVYVFPLPENAAVNEFIMTVGERRIRGIIREREQAQQIYNQARAQGHVASLMTQERPNIFMQKVANIEPGKQIDISIRYFNTLRYDKGAYEFVFPMVVGPRYNPSHVSDGVGAVARGDLGASGQATEVQYLAPNERSGHDISLSLNIDAGVEIQDVQCINHGVDVSPVSECQRRVLLVGAENIPNKDFVLRYRVAGDQIKTAMLTHKDQHGQYFTMMVYPPAEIARVQRSPMEMVFVLDCSGSMNGRPIEQAKAAIAHSLQQLTPRDTFQIIQFSNTSSQLGSSPIPATQANIQKGLRYLASFQGEGGTEMLNGIKAALDFPHDEGRFRLVSFMTDGFIGNEQQILETMSQKIGASRVFSFGVGQAPNRFLMDRMAVLGRGAVCYLSLNDDAIQIMDGFHQQISHPAMTDLVVDFGDMQVTDVYPQRLPDLIVGRPIVITGRFTGTPSTVTVGGRIGIQPASFTVSVDKDHATDAHPGLAAVWARLKIADLMTEAARMPDQLADVRAKVTETALNHNLMSSYTSFVAVDSMSKTDGSFGTSVVVPVLVPEGVKYNTTVSN